MGRSLLVKAKRIWVLVRQDISIKKKEFSFFLFESQNSVRCGREGASGQEELKMLD